MKNGLKTAIKWILTLAITAGTVYLVVKEVDFLETWAILSNANYLWALIPIPVMILSHIIRAERWRTMLGPITKAKSMLNLFSAVMVGYAVNNLVPRGGELVRPFVYAKREKLSFSTVFATIVVERVIDVITLMLLFGGVFIFMQGKIINALPEDIQTQNIVFLVGAIILAISISLYPPFFKALIKIFIKPFSQAFYERVSGIFDRFRKGFAVIKRPSQYARLIAESLAMWFCYMLPMYLTFFAFDFQTQFQLGIDDATLLVVITGVGMSIAPTPGGVGIYHYLVQTAMVRLYGISPEAALAYATVNHAINFLVQTIIGGIFLLRENIKQIPTSSEEIPDNLEHK